MHALDDISLAALRILVVDDHPDARRLLEWVLTDASAEVMTAESANEALDLVKEHRFDAIVSDIGMPERDGYQFIGDVRSLEPARGGRTPAVALTAFARSEDRKRALDAGFQLHMAKPVEPAELVAAIRSLVANDGG